MASAFLIPLWSLAAGIPITVLYRRWTHVGGVFPWRPVAAWITWGFCAWALTGGLGWLVALLLLGLALIGVHVLVLVTIVMKADAALMWWRSRKAVKR